MKENYLIILNFGWTKINFWPSTWSRYNMAIVIKKLFTNISFLQTGVELELVDSVPLLEWLANNYKSFGKSSIQKNCMYVEFFVLSKWPFSLHFTTIVIFFLSISFMSLFAGIWVLSWDERSVPSGCYKFRLWFYNSLLQDCLMQCFFADTMKLFCTLLKVLSLAIFK